MHCFKLGTLFAMIFILCAGLAAQTDSGSPKAVPGGDTGTIFRKATVAPDGVEFAADPGIPGTVSGFKDTDMVSPVPAQPNPCWTWLAGLDQADRENALIELESSGGTSAAVRGRLHTIEALWNGGRYDAAIDALRALEETREGIGLAVGTAWKVARPASSMSRYGTDVQVGTNTDVKETHLDFHAGTGNLFIITKVVSGTSSFWTCNISTDDGQTWSETYQWNASYVIVDISAVVCDSYVWVGYVGGTTGMDARIRRCMASDGSVDSAYGFVTVFNAGVEIREISLCSNADFYDNRIYYWAILNDDSLHYWWDSPTGTGWAEIATGVTNAKSSLDSSCQENYLSNFAMCCYRDTSDYVTVLTKASAFTVHTMSSTTTGDVAVSAYDSHIIVVYEYAHTNGPAIRYNISYDDGVGTWYYGYVASPVTSEAYFSPDVAARGGGGISVVYEEEVGEPDPVWERNRTYAGGWSTPVTFNEKDVITGSPTRTEYLPPISGTKAYGAIWFSTSYIPWFDRSDAGASGPSVDIKVNGSDTAITIPWPTPVDIDFDVTAGGSSISCDIWIVTTSPWGFFLYNGSGPYLGWWLDPVFIHPYYTGTLTNMSGNALNNTIPKGKYKAIIGIDTVANGRLDLGSILVKDSVDFKVD